MQGSIWIYLYAAGVICLGIAWLWPAKRTQGEEETVFWTALQQMKKEHQQFMQSVSKVKQSFDRQRAELSEQISRLEARLEQAAVSASETEAGELSVRDELLLHDRYKDIFALKKRGMSNEEIAKELDMGKGEVDLIVQLAESSGGKAQ